VLPLLLLVTDMSILRVSSQAPGDGDSFCTQLSEAVTPPAYPPNVVPLMDSYHYLNLLSPVPSYPSTWQQVDEDNIPDSYGGATEVSLDNLNTLNHILLKFFD